MKYVPSLVCMWSLSCEVSFCPRRICRSLYSREEGSAGQKCPQPVFEKEFELRQQIQSQLERTKHPIWDWMFIQLELRCCALSVLLLRLNDYTLLSGLRHGGRSSYNLGEDKGEIQPRTGTPIYKNVHDCPFSLPPLQWVNLTHATIILNGTCHFFVMKTLYFTIIFSYCWLSVQQNVTVYYRYKNLFVLLMYLQIIY